MPTIFVAALMLAAAPVQATPTLDEPTVEQLKANVEPFIRRQLNDPEETEIAWPYHSLVSKGDVITCGVLHGNNRMGGRIRAWVLVNSSRHFKDSASPYFNILDGENGQNTMCDAWMQRGQLVAR